MTSILLVCYVLFRRIGGILRHGEPDEAVFSACFGFVECFVRQFIEILEFVDAGIGADADAAREGLCLSKFQVVEAFQYFTGNFISPFCILRGYACHEHHEFVAADPPDDVAGPETADQDFCEGNSGAFLLLQ